MRLDTLKPGAAEALRRAGFPDSASEHVSTGHVILWHRDMPGLIVCSGCNRQWTKMEQGVGR